MTKRSTWIGLGLVVALAGGGSWGARELERWRLGERAAHAVQPGDITMYSATSCGICKQAKKWFARHEIPVQSCEIDLDRDCAKRFWALKSPGTPVFLVRGEKQIGFSREQMVEVLERPRAARQVSSARQAE